MEQKEQIDFVKVLIETLKIEILNKIKDGKIPDNWDGIELRQYISDCFSDCTYKMMLRGKRKRDYKNTVIVNNL